MTLSKVQQAAAKQAKRLAKQAERKAAQSTTERARAVASCKHGASKAGKAEARRMALGELAVSKARDGMNYAVDARKARKHDKPAAAKYSKQSDFGTRTATAGSKTDATINSYRRAKAGDNLPRK